MSSFPADTGVHAVDHAVRTAPWFHPRARVLVAVSGGPDSMALLAALHTLVPAGVEITAAHFDHGMRAESALDIDTVRRFADPNGIPVIADRADVPARARAAGVSLETAARAARYAFLAAAAGRVGADWIATAHTRSDQVETVLMRILRGARERGLAGIPRERDRIVRPLLGVAPADTRDYCSRRAIPCVDDPTNTDRRFTRNAVRLDVLPALRRAYPGLDDALLRTSRLADAVLADARAITAARLSLLRAQAGGTWVLPIGAFDNLDCDAAAVLLGDALARIGRYDDIRSLHYDALASLLDTGAVGRAADLPGVSVRRDHDALVFRPRGTGAGNARPTGETALAVPGSATLGGWTIRADVVDASGVQLRGTDTGTDRYVAFVAAGNRDRLRVRAPRPGDRMRPFGMTGTRKLSDVFVDAKVPHRVRAHLVVVEAQGEIVWVPGIATGENARVYPGDALTLRLDASRDGDAA